MPTDNTRITLFGDEVKKNWTQLRKRMDDPGAIVLYPAVVEKDGQWGLQYS